MANRFPVRALLLGFGLCGVGMAQQYTPLPPPLVTDPCTVKPNPAIPVEPDPKAKKVVCPPPGSVKAVQPAPAGGEPSAADKFPFPGSQPVAPANANQPAAEKFPYPGSAPAAAPAAPSAPATGAGDKFPYPGETSKSPDAVPEGDTPRYVPDSPAPGDKAAPPQGAGDSGSSSSSSSGDSSSSSSSSSSGDSQPGGGSDPFGDAPTRRRKLPKVKAESPDERVTEDLKVAKFYSSLGNYTAAYMRSKDAIHAMPNDPESHYRLAQAAEKLKKKDEAVAEYTAYLKLDPAGDWADAAHKALEELH